MSLEAFATLREISNHIYKDLGPGFSERIYHNALLAEFRDRKIHYDTEVLYPVYYKNHSIGFIRCDIIAHLCGMPIIIEIKSIIKPNFRDNDSEYIQLQRYIDVTNIKHGILINFPKRQDTPLAFREINDSI